MLHIMQHTHTQSQMQLDGSQGVQTYTKAMHQVAHDRHSTLISTDDILQISEIVLERVLVLFRAGTSSLRSGLGTFFVPVPDHAKHFP